MSTIFPIRFAAALVPLLVCSAAHAETPEEWVKLGARVHAVSRGQ